MNTPIAFTSRATALRAIVLAASFLLGITVNSAQAAPKSEDSKPAAPVSVTFEQSAGENGPYIMTVANKGSDEIKVKVSVVASVQAHNKPKKREFPQTSLAAGKGMTVNEVAANDRVMVRVKGYAMLELVAPAGTN